MKVIQFLLAVVAVLLAGPVLFVVAFAIGEGCLLCMEGHAPGSATEKVLNLGLLLLVAGAAIAFFWKKIKDKVPKD